MKTLFGLFLIILGILTGLYVGVYLLLFGGITMLIHGCQQPMHVAQIAWGVVRIACASPAGWLCFIALTGAGVGMMSN
jgi:hypothetical protein